MLAGVRREHLGTLLLGLLLFAGAAWAMRTLRVQSMGQYLASQRYEDIYYLPPKEWLPVMSLGYREAAADLIWMRALVYYGEEFEHQGQVRYAIDYAEAALELDPYFRAVYSWIRVASAYHPTGIAIDDIRRSIAIMESGVALFPDDGQLAWQTGAQILYEYLPQLKGTERAKEKARLQAHAEDYLDRAARLGAGPPWLSITNASHLLRLGQTSQAIAHLEETYGLVRDPSVRQQIAIQLSRLRSQAASEGFIAANQQFDKEHDAEFPYTSAELYVFLRPRDGDAWVETLRYDFLNKPTAAALSLE